MPPILKEIALYLTRSPRSRFRQLQELREMDDRMLRDIGLTRYDAVRVASDPITPSPASCARRNQGVVGLGDSRVVSQFEIGAMSDGLLTGICRIEAPADMLSDKQHRPTSVIDEFKAYPPEGPYIPHHTLRQRGSYVP